MLEELTRVLEPSRAERGCVAIHLYEATRNPLAWFIHSEWMDEDAFEIHAELPHTRHLLEALGELMANPFQAVRTRQIN